MAVVILPELAFGHSKRYLLRCAQPYRNSKATRDVSQSKICQSGAGTHRNPKYTKAAINCRTPKIQIGEKSDEIQIKAVRGRTVIPKRHETCRNPKYIKAVRGRTAIQNILKRQ